ncbi:MAG: anaerobic sulfatase maturase [Propionibacteriaceae bacterium]|nr:anaerobic sulfatase maturase [Propionibacteriaceae bacterium]
MEDVARHPFSVMAKPVGSTCNLRCTYCYYLATPTMAPRMSDAVLEAFISGYIAAGVGLQPDQTNINFVWHGGEPTLAGLDFYRRVVELQGRYLPKGWTAWNNLQTNGVLLDDQWCQFLADNRFDVGLSIDGTEWIHDKFRPDPRGRGSYDAAASAIRRLQAHGVQPDLLCTVTSTAADHPLEVYRNLRAFGTGWMEFIPIVVRDGTGLTPESVTGEAYGRFLVEVFDEWALHDLGTTAVQLFAETANTLGGGAPGLCWLAPTCGRALVVEADGGVYSCDHFVRPRYRLGDVGNLAALADSAAQQAFGQAKADLPDKCRDCPWLALCNGGCPKDRPGNGINILCDGLTAFFARAVPELRTVVAMASNGYASPAIMDALRTARAEKWQGVGRNDPCPCGSGRKAKHCCWPKRPL